MTNTVKLMEQTERGRRASMVLEDIKIAFDALEADCFDTFKNSELHDDEGRKDCRIYMRVLEDVKERFEDAVNTGEAARKSLTKIGEVQHDD